MESVEEKIVSEASAVDGDAEDNTTTIDCSSDDKPKGGGDCGSGGDAQIPTSGISGAANCPNKKPCKGDPPMNKSRRKKDLQERRGRRGRGGPQQRKRRRGGANRNQNKSKRDGEKKSVNWQLPDQRHQTDARKDVIVTPLVPYNTNRFLMEYHMEEVPPATGPTVGRDEFLTNEFSEVYETHLCERLEGMSKQQLIQEYLQIEANYDQLRQRCKADASNGSHSVHAKANRAKWESHWRAMKEQVRRLSAENHELRSELMRLKGEVPPPRQGPSGVEGGEDSVDSESDSSMSSISSRSSSCSRSSRGSSRSSSSSSGSGSCCSSRCSSRDSKGNVLPSRQNSGDEAMVVVEGENGQNTEGLNSCSRPHQHRRRHRTHRQRRNSRLNHTQQLGVGVIIQENGTVQQQDGQQA